MSAWQASLRELVIDYRRTKIMTHARRTPPGTVVAGSFSGGVDDGGRHAEVGVN
jgi:hypothetical protein